MLSTGGAYFFRLNSGSFPGLIFQSLDSKVHDQKITLSCKLLKYKPSSNQPNPLLRQTGVAWTFLASSYYSEAPISPSTVKPKLIFAATILPAKKKTQKNKPWLFCCQKYHLLQLKECQTSFTLRLVQTCLKSGPFAKYGERQNRQEAEERMHTVHLDMEMNAGLRNRHE